MSSQAVWIRSLTSLPLLTDFLKHSCNLSSVKGDPPLRRKNESSNLATRKFHNLSFLRQSLSNTVYTAFAQKKVDTTLWLNYAVNGVN